MYMDKQAAPPWAEKTDSAAGYGDAQRQAEIPHQSQRLDKALAYVDESLRELLTRIECVVRPRAPEPAMQGAQIGPVGPSTGFGMELGGYAKRAEELGERIQDYLRRLEV